MLFMNTWEIEGAVLRYKNHPVLSKATRYLQRWEAVVNANSDGWAYWSGGPNAAKQLMLLIQNPDTATEAALKKALGPIKATCTRKKLPCPAFD